MVEAAFQQEVARRGGRVVALEKYPLDPGKMAEPIRRVAQAAGQVDSIFIADGADAVPQVVQKLAASGVNPKRVQLLGTGLWDDPRIFSTAALEGGWYAAPESTGFRNFSGALPRALSGRTRCARRRSPMTRWRWSPRW